MRTQWGVQDVPDQRGTVAMVTGANGGLGLRTAEALAGAGATVVMACRDQAKARAGIDVVRRASRGAEPLLVRLDLADLSAVRDAADAVAELVPRVDVLVNNAGVMALPRRVTVDGFEQQFGTNHLGHFALTGRLLGCLLAAEAPRVVTVSSIMHWGGRMAWRDLQGERRYSRWGAYCQSKLANLLFTTELQRRATRAGTALLAIAAHPGIADTELQTVGPAMGGHLAMARAAKLGNRLIAQPDTMGMLPILRAATDPDVRGDDFFGPAGPLPGPMEWRGHPKRVPRSPAARRQADAERLWTVSEELSGVSYDWAVAPVRSRP